MTLLFLKDMAEQAEQTQSRIATLEILGLDEYLHDPGTDLTGKTVVVGDDRGTFDSASLRGSPAVQMVIDRLDYNNLAYHLGGLEGDVVAHVNDPTGERLRALGNDAERHLAGLARNVVAVFVGRYRQDRVKIVEEGQFVGVQQ